MHAIEITPFTAAIWAMNNVITFQSVGQERVWFENEFGMRFFYEHTGYCMV